MSFPITNNPDSTCLVSHVNHTHGQERPGMPIHCSYCGLIAPGHEERMAIQAEIAAHKCDQECGETEYCPLQEDWRMRRKDEA